MRLLWPISLAAITQLSSAFYPYIPPPDEHTSTPSSRDLNHEERSPFYPYIAPTTETERNSDKFLKAVEFPRDPHNGAMRISLRKLPKRQNNFNVIPAQNPKQSNSAGIEQDGTDFSYFGSFNVGTSSKTFYLLLDSAASNTWFMSSSCTTSACGLHTTLGTSDSSSLKVSQNTFSVAYGTGSVAGNEGTDTIHLGSISVPLTFGLAQNVSNEFDSYPMDGILGLGRPDTLGSNPTGIVAPSLMDELISQNVISSKLFGMRLWRSADGGNNNGELNFGSPDTSAYDGKLNYISAITDTNGFWEIPIDDAGVDGKKVGLTGRSAIIDSGTSFILMPQDDAATLLKAIPGFTQNGESFTVPCSATNKVQIVFGGVAYNISPKDYVGKPSGSGCTSNIIGRQVFGSTQWLVGDVFMKNVYTVFDYDNQRIGLGVKASSQSTTSTGGAKTTSTLSPITSQISVSNLPSTSQTPSSILPITSSSQTSTYFFPPTSLLVQSSQTYTTSTAPSSTQTQAPSTLTSPSSTTSPQQSDSASSSRPSPSQTSSILTTSSIVPFSGTSFTLPIPTGAATASGYQQPTALIPAGSGLTDMTTSRSATATGSASASTTRASEAGEDRRRFSLTIFIVGMITILCLWV